MLPIVNCFTNTQTLPTVGSLRVIVTRIGFYVSSATPVDSAIITAREILELHVAVGMGEVTVLMAVKAFLIT